MWLPILWFSLWIFALPVNCEIECVQCDGRVDSVDKTCSNCTGDYCFYMNYKYVYPSFANETVVVQGCFTTPTAYPTGCSRNANGNTMCICNSENHCNDHEIQIPPAANDVSYINCSYAPDNLYSTAFSCMQAVCKQESTSSSFSPKLECLPRDVEMEMYDFGTIVRNIFLPNNACYKVQATYDYDDEQACIFSSNAKTKRNEKSMGKTKCYVPQTGINQRMKNSTCTSQFCFASEDDYGCISQFDRKGPELKAGLYRLTPFIAPFYICDSDFCNNETLIVKERNFYPTTFQWNSAQTHCPPWLILFSSAAVMYFSAS